jgi:basic membrane protein A
VDENNAELITPEMAAQVDEAAAAMAAGELAVHDYMTDESCPALTF